MTPLLHLMKTSTMLTSLITAAMMSPMLVAQVPIVRTAPVQVQPSAKHFSSNAVRAIFRGFKDQEASPTLSDMLSPESGSVGQHRIAIFEVIEPLAYKRLSSYASQQMVVGQLFKVELDIPVFGQDIAITEMVKTLQVGEEVVAKVDEVFVFDGQREGHLQTPLVRMVRRNAAAQAGEATEIQAQELDESPAPLVQVAAPMPSTNQAGQNQRQARFNTMNRTVQTVRVRNGVRESIRVETEMIAGTNRSITRMYINDVEVDPETQEPLASTSPMPQVFNEPLPAEQPAQQAPVQKQEPIPLPTGETF